MKKLLTILLCSVLALSLVGVADAAGSQFITGEDYNDGNGDREVTVSLVVDDSFSVEIPDSISLTKHTDGIYRKSYDVETEITAIGHGKNLTVFISSGNYDTNSWHLKHETDTNEVLDYGIKLGSHITGADDSELLANNSAILSTSLPESEVTVHFRLLSESIDRSGTYQDTITFTVEIRDDVVNPTYISGSGS